MEVDTAAAVSALNGVVCGLVGGSFTSPLNVHRYRVALTSTAKINKQVDMNTRSILFNIGVRGSTNTLMPLRPVDISGTAMAFASSPAIASELAGAARKATQMASRWEKMDMSGVVERLASAIAVYRATGDLTQSQVAGGRKLSVIAVDGVTQSIAASAGHVFVPASAVTSTTPHVLAALCCAVTGAGSTLVTDLLGVDANTNSVKAPYAKGPDLAAGCYHALSLLGANYEAHNQGNLFAYALTVGLHKVMTVHAHTDEGGFTRDVFRKAWFGNSYGGIVSSVEAYTALPRPDVSLDGFVKLVDNLCFATAGIVALCDPLTVVDGRFYPTVYDTFRDGGPESGKKTDDQDARVHLRTIASTYTGFSSRYARALGMLFNTKGGDEGVIKHMNSTVNGMVGSALSHLKYRVVSPFFWIEPTGSVHVDGTGLEAQAEGYGHLCTPYKDGRRPAFNNAIKLADLGLHSGWSVEWVAARKHGMLHHLNLHKLDGLANIVPRQIDGESMTLCGRGDSTRPYLHVNERVLLGVSVDEYLWGRGHSSVIAPAEALYVGKTVSLLFKHTVVEDGGLSLTPSHFPRVDEVMQDVLFEVGRGNFIGEVKPDTPDKLVNRERRAANRALHAARLFQSGTQHIDALFPVMVADPTTGVQTPKSEAAPHGLEVTASRFAEEDVLPIESLDQYDSSTGFETSVVVSKNLPTTVRHSSVPGPRQAGTSRAVAWSGHGGADAPEVLIENSEAALRQVGGIGSKTERGSKQTLSDSVEAAEAPS